MKTSIALIASLLLGATAQAQVCGLRNHIRLVHGMSEGNAPSELRLDTGWLTTEPLFSSAIHAVSNPQGCHSEGNFMLESTYGFLHYWGEGHANNCGCCGVFLWADEWIGGEPKAQFKDRITAQSASLPPGTPVTVRGTVTLWGGTTATHNGMQSFSVRFSTSNGVFSPQLLNTTGTQSATFTLPVGQSTDILGRINCALSDNALLASGSLSGSITADLSAVFTLEVLTPNASITSCSGHDYSPVPACDSIDFNGDSLFPDTQDIDDFLSVFSGGLCSTGACGDIDFNNDGLFPDTADIDSLLSVFSGGACL